MAGEERPKYTPSSEGTLGLMYGELEKLDGASAILEYTSSL
jgi:hypothetical protein